ncbi:replication initiation factor domain-containing protein [Colwellia sp. MEBiC06753]
MTNKVTSKEQKSLIDLIKIQFEPNDSITDSVLVILLKEQLKNIGLVKSSRKPNLRYFEKGFKLIAQDATQDVVGAIKWQGQSGNVQLELTGKGCNYVNSYPDKFIFLYEFAKKFKGQLIEIDIAVDDFSEKYGFRQVNRDYTSGKFSGLAGKKPIREKFDKAGAKSIRIGTRGSCKQFQLYDKARQLKLDDDASWLRHEVSLYRKTG